VGHVHRVQQDLVVVHPEAALVVAGHVGVHAVAGPVAVRFALADFDLFFAERQTNLGRRISRTPQSLRE
jgi:hypothetical protein